MVKAGRNDPCPCGSGKKYKKCCGQDQVDAPAKGNASASVTNKPAQLDAVPPHDMNLLATLFNAGRYEELESNARTLLKRYPNSGLIWQILGIALKVQGKDALSALQKATDLMPNDAGAHNNLGTALQEMGRFQDAVTSYRQALKIKPDFIEVCNNLGNTLKDLGRFDDAIASYRQVLEIKPDFAEAYSSLGNVLKGIGRLDSAEESYRRALKIKPDFISARNSLLTTLNYQALGMQGIGQLDEAIAKYRQALEIKSDVAELHSNLGNALKDRGRFDEALTSYLRALEINPDMSEAHGSLGNALRENGRLDEAAASSRRALELNPGLSVAYNNLLMTLQFFPMIEKQELFDNHRRFGEQFETPLKVRWPGHANDRDADKRLKIGYVSGDFRQHAVAFFIEPVLNNHDKSQVEVFCYSNSRMHDAASERLRSVADHWLPCFGMSDDELAQSISADGIDILVDLSGHSAHNRLLTFARKPAPIQITYLGYPGSSGLSAMDYRLTDRYTEPGDDQYYTEQLLRLPDSLWCYQPTESMPEVTSLPALANGYLTFGSFNNFNKIGEGCIALWANLLRSLPGARLLMVTVPEGEVRIGLIRQFEDLGIASDRLEFCGKLPSQEFQRKLQQVDITLDPFPVNGATTTCESLWLGVPVLTLVGQRFLSRAGFSLLSTAQLPEFAVETPEQLIATAMRLANDLPRLAEIRAGMRERLRGTPLLDQQRFTRNLEAIYRDVWRRYISA